VREIKTVDINRYRFNYTDIFDNAVRRLCSINFSVVACRRFKPAGTCDAVSWRLNIAVIADCSLRFKCRDFKGWFNRCPWIEWFYRKMYPDSHYSTILLGRRFSGKTHGNIFHSSGWRSQQYFPIFNGKGRSHNSFLLSSKTTACYIGIIHHCLTVLIWVTAGIIIRYPNMNIRF